MQVKQIIIRFLDTYTGTIISSHNLQLEVPLFALSVYNKMVNPETVSRAWRLLRDDKVFLEQNGYSIIEQLGQNSKEKKWQIRKLNEIHRNSERGSKEQRDNNPSIGSEETSIIRPGALS